MGTIVKIGVVSAAIGLVIWLANYARQAAAAFSYSIARYGSPSLNGSRLQVPITIKFNNSTPLPINVDNLHADIYLDKNGTWTKTGVIDQPLSVPPGTSEQTLITMVDTSQLVGSIASLISLVNSALTSKSISLRTDLTVNYAGVSLPTQSFIKQISFA